MAKVHNKKRNIGIIYEQIIQYMCKRIMENDEVTSEKAIKIIKEHFADGTQLQKEYKLFKALSDTKNVSGHLANSIIFEAKKACNNMFDGKKLEREKSKLIKNLNYSFGKGIIFNENVENYRIYATIQTLLNEWRDPKNASFDLTTKYEIKLHESLTEKVEIVKETKTIPKIDNLTYNLMNNIFEKKYSSFLNENQNKILKNYAKNEEELLRENFSILKEETLSCLNSYIANCDNNILLEKYKTVKNNISDVSTENTSRDNLQRYLTIAKLKEELLGGE
mgnify:FL=1|tara:strand:- start:531 stop:1367 length:837 start_codon:yes stop_codon:yes gene_type:complete